MAFSATSKKQDLKPNHTGASIVEAIPENELVVAESAIQQFIIRGHPLVQTASHVWEYRAGTPILVSQETWGNATTSTIRVPSGQERAFRDYVERNRRNASWGRPASLAVPCEFAPELSVSMAAYWNQLRRTHPRATGVLTLSRPGFGADGQSAWIQIYINTGPGTSPRMAWFLHLQHVDSSWSLKEARTLTGDDRHFAGLPKKIPREGGLLWELGRKGSYEERIANKRLVEP